MVNWQATNRSLENIGGLTVTLQKKKKKKRKLVVYSVLAPYSSTL